MHSGLLDKEAQVIAQGQWFAGLDTALQSALLRNSRVMRLEGKALRNSRRLLLGGSLYAVAGGAAKLSRRMASGRDLTLQLFEPGTWFGGGIGSSHAQCSYLMEPRGELVLLVVEAPELQALKAMHPSLSHAMLLLHERLLHRMGEMLEEISDMPLAMRVSRQLAALGDRFGVTDGARVKLSVPVSQQDLADLTGACRQRVNAEIKAFERQGVLRMVRGCVELTV